MGGFMIRLDIDKIVFILLKNGHQVSRDAGFRIKII